MRHVDVGVLDSLAWRGEGQVHLALHLPDAGLAPGAEGVMLQLRDGDRRVRRAAMVATAATGVLVEASVPGPRLADGLWRIALRPGPDADLVRLEARLLVKPGQPVALIPGPEPKTRMAPPLPEPVPATASVPSAIRRAAGRLVQRRDSRS
jgi:hypothetical protein